MRRFLATLCCCEGISQPLLNMQVIVLWNITYNEWQTCQHIILMFLLLLLSQFTWHESWQLLSWWKILIMTISAQSILWVFFIRHTFINIQGKQCWILHSFYLQWIGELIPLLYICGCLKIVTLCKTFLTVSGFKTKQKLRLSVTKKM